MNKLYNLGPRSHGLAYRYNDFCAPCQLVVIIVDVVIVTAVDDI